MVTPEPIVGQSDKNFTDAAIKAVEEAERRNLLPPNQDSNWKVDLRLVVEHHSPSHIKWFMAELKPGG